MVARPNGPREPCLSSPTHRLKVGEAPMMHSEDRYMAKNLAAVLIGLAGITIALIIVANYIG